MTYGPPHLVFVYDAAHAIGSERPEAFAEIHPWEKRRREVRTWS